MSGGRVRATGSETPARDARRAGRGGGSVRSTAASTQFRESVERQRAASRKDEGRGKAEGSGSGGETEKTATVELVRFIHAYFSSG